MHSYQEKIQHLLFRTKTIVSSILVKRIHHLVTTSWLKRTFIATPTNRNKIRPLLLSALNPQKLHLKVAFKCATLSRTLQQIDLPKIQSNQSDCLKLTSCQTWKKLRINKLIRQLNELQELRFHKGQVPIDVRITLIFNRKEVKQRTKFQIKTHIVI